MILTRVLAGVGIAALLAVGGFAAAPNSGADAPQPYPPPVCAQISVSATVVAAGEPLDVTGEGFPPEHALDVVANPGDVVLARTRTDAAGRFDVTVRFPKSLRGHRIISVDGAGPTCPPDPVTVTVGSGGSSTPPASTGVDVELGLIAGVVLVVFGALFAGGGRRRNI